MAVIARYEVREIVIGRGGAKYCSVEINTGQMRRDAGAMMSNLVSHAQERCSASAESGNSARWR